MAKYANTSSYRRSQKRKRTPFRKKKMTKRKTFAKRVQRVINRNVETKMSCLRTENSYASGTIQLGHNYLSIIDTNMVSTSQGITDPVTSATNNRIGDKVMVKNIRLQFALQLDQTQPQCQYKIFVVKSSHGDYPTDGIASDLFVSFTGNNMMDYVDKKKFTILASKYGTITQRGLGTVGGVYSGETGSGQVDAQAGNLRLAPTEKIVSLNLPGKLFGRNGSLQYQQGAQSTKHFQYSVHVLSYVNGLKMDTGPASYNGLRLNCYTRRMYFTDM